MPEQIVAEREERPLGRMGDGQGGHSPGFLERRYYVLGKTWGPVGRRSRWLGDFGRLEALSG